MTTFRSMAVTATAAVSVIVLAGCGNSTGHDTAPPSQTGAVLPTAGPIQPLADWLPASTSILHRLSTDLYGLSGTMSAGGTPDPGSLTRDATEGLNLAAPDGYPDLDQAWDAVMNDYLIVSGDLASGDNGRTTTDLAAASADMDTLQAESAKL